ncbi:hypothetical protein Pmani_004306 [Petrolisthes manimaculis]|uniref:DUF7041 domain-containing protein n=1 Tax=Petrolisthes manimaculis TaxID=1843537 RepID=A0AAE1QGW5_9EUCA|nr:hypothetical protein Pmani_004306 [Petrolisthes manimaculis]
MAEPQDIEPIPTISTFRAPPFSSHDPTLWFTILEVNFKAHHITTSLKKFSVATTLLPPEVLSQLADSVTAACTSDTLYEDLKTAITTRLEASLSTPAVLRHHHPHPSLLPASFSDHTMQPLHS